MELTPERLRSIVLGSLAFSHPRGVADIIQRLSRARIRLEVDQVEEALLELAVAGQVEAVGARWQRV